MRPNKRKEKRKKQGEKNEIHGLYTCIMNNILQSITDYIMSANIEIKHKIKSRKQNTISLLIPNNIITCSSITFFFFFFCFYITQQIQNIILFKVIMYKKKRKQFVFQNPDHFVVCIKGIGLYGT